jgi:hypothetical protein
LLKSSDIIFATLVALLSAGIALILYLMPEVASALSPGRMMAGHEALGCETCHKAAPGTMRQQIQANIAYWIGRRNEGAAFGNRPVASADCIVCHSRKDDHHPIHRFREPRFLEAVNQLDARTCLSCHVEHKGKRVAAGSEQCRFCHARLILKDDPINIPHATLALTGQWTTCLGCHDFHGNHVRETPKALQARIEVERIEAYLRDGPSPYGTQKREEARKP